MCQSQDRSLIEMEAAATCQPSEAESTKAGLNETSRKYRLVKKIYNTKKNAEPPHPPPPPPLRVEIPVQNIILRLPFFKDIYSKRQYMHAYATFAVMWIGNIHDMYIISYFLKLSKWIIIHYNELWRGEHCVYIHVMKLVATSKFIWNVMKKGYTSKPWYQKWSISIFFMRFI